MTTTETKAPLPVAVEDAINELEIEYPPTGGHDIRGGEHYSNIIRAHIASLEADLELQKDLVQRAHDNFDRMLKQMRHYEKLAAASSKQRYDLEADNKRMREALKPFAGSYVKNNVLSGCSGFVKLCADSTSPANWFDAAEALAQTDGKAGA